MRGNKREKILKAALKVIAREGFFHSKVEDIAGEAGVATGTPYLYFENKDDILISIFEEEMVPIIEKIQREVDSCTTCTKKIVTFVKCQLQMIEENPDMAQLLEVELRQSSKFMRGYRGGTFKKYLDILGNAFAEGQKAGEFRGDINPSLFKQMVFGAVDQISMNWTLSRSKKYTLKTSGEQIVEVILNGISNQS